MRSFLTALLVSGFLHGFSQRIENIQASFQDGKVTVAYELNGASPNQKFTIEIFCSHNNFTSALANVSGDVGKGITPGTGKKIVWNAEEELGEFKGEISFRVRGSEIIAPIPIAFKAPQEGGSIRRGKTTIVQWDGGSLTQTVRLELYKGTERINTIAETKNSGQFTWRVPKDLSKGKYTLKLTHGQQEVTNNLLVKSKFPLLLKVLPVVAVGGVVAALSGGGSKSGSNDLPAAPGPK